MKSVRWIVADEVAVGLMVSMVQVVVCLLWPVPGEEFLVVWSDIVRSCTELNSVVVLAFLIGLVLNGGIKLGKGSLKKIMKVNLVTVIVNTLIMMVAGVFGWGGMAFATAALYGNLDRFWGICKEYLGVI